MNPPTPTPPAGPRRIVLTLLGPDKRGIVARVASTIAAHGGNWMESRMVRLGGQFAGLVQAQVPEHAYEDLRAAVAKLADMNLRLTIEESSPAETTPPRRQIELELLTPDRPGILKEISAILAAHELNVEELATEFVAAPWSGALLFKALIKVSTPAGLDADKLRDDIEATSVDMMLDLSISLI